MSSSPPAPLTPLLLHELPQVTYLIHMLPIYSFPCSSSSFFLFYFSLFFISSAKSPHIYFCFHFSLRCSFDVPPTFCSQAACVLAGARAHWSHSKWRKNQGRASWQLAPRLPLCSIVLSSTRGTLNRWSNFIFTATLFWTMPSVRFPISCSSHPIGDWMTLWHARSRMKGGRVQLRPRWDQVLGLAQSQGMKTTWGCFWKSVCTAHIYVCHCLVLAVTSLRWWSGEEIFVKSQSHKIWGLEIRSVVRNGNLGQKKRRRLIRAFRVRALTLSPSLILNCCHLCSAKR